MKGKRKMDGWTAEEKNKTKTRGWDGVTGLTFLESRVTATRMKKVSNVTNRHAARAVQELYGLEPLIERKQQNKKTVGGRGGGERERERERERREKDVDMHGLFT